MRTRAGCENENEDGEDDDDDDGLLDCGGTHSVSDATASRRVRRDADVRGLLLCRVRAARHGVQPTSKIPEGVVPHALQRTRSAAVTGERRAPLPRCACVYVYYA